MSFVAEVAVPVSERAWCYYRNLVQTVYREIRHAGRPDDPDARLVVPDEPLAPAMAEIRKWRAALKSTQLFGKVREGPVLCD